MLVSYWPICFPVPSNSQKSLQKFGFFLNFLTTLLVTDEFHFRDENIFYQFMIDKVVTRKMIDTLGIVDDKAPGSPRNFRRRNLPPLNTQRSSPVPFLKEKPQITEPLGR